MIFRKCTQLSFTSISHQYLYFLPTEVFNLTINAHTQQGGERKRDDIRTMLQKVVKITTDI